MIIGGKSVTKDLLERLYSNIPLLMVLDIHGTILSHKHKPIVGHEKDVYNALKTIELHQIPVVIVTDGSWYEEMEVALKKLFKPHNLLCAVLDPGARERMTRAFGFGWKLSNTKGKRDAYHVLQKVTNEGELVLADDLPVNVHMWNSLPHSKAHQVITSLKPSMIPNVFPRLSWVSRKINRSEDEVMDAFEQTRQCFGVKHNVVSNVIVDSIPYIKNHLSD